MTPRLAATMGPTVTFRIADGASASLVSATFSPSACWTHIGTVKHKSPGLQHVLVSHRATSGANRGSLKTRDGDLSRRSSRRLPIAATSQLMATE